MLKRDYMATYISDSPFIIETWVSFSSLCCVRVHTLQLIPTNKLYEKLGGTVFFVLFLFKG